MNSKNFEISGVSCHLIYKIAFLLLISFQASINTNAQKIKSFNDSCCLPNAKPLFLKKGDKVNIGCDTAYLINAYRLHLYEKARNYLISLAGNSGKMVVNQAEDAVNQLDTYFAEVQSRYFLLSEEIKKNQVENKARLQTVNYDLDEVRKDLQITKTDLKDLEEKLKRSRRKEKTNRLVFGSIGTAAGLILGAILFH